MSGGGERFAFAQQGMRARCDVTQARVSGSDGGRASPSAVCGGAVRLVAPSVAVAQLFSAQLS